MKKLTKQNVLDKVWIHLRKQRQKAVNESGNCLYRAKNGNMCAMGALMPDSCYSRKFEFTGIRDLFEDVSDYSKPVQKKLNAFFALFGPDVAEVFLEELQGIHDNYDVAEWEQELTKLAKHEKLKPRAPLSRPLKEKTT